MATEAIIYFEDLKAAPKRCDAPDVESPDGICPNMTFGGAKVIPFKWTLCAKHRNDKTVQAICAALEPLN